MAFQTKGHAQMLGMMNDFHLINSTMAFHATYTPVHVDGMVEVYIVRDFMNPYPWYGRTRSEQSVLVQVFFIRKSAVFIRVFSKIGISNYFQKRRIGLDVFMARHTDIGGRNICMGRFVYTMMTIPAVEAELSGVKTMIIGYRLRRFVSNSGILRSRIISDARCDCSTYQAETYH